MRLRCSLARGLLISGLCADALAATPVLQLQLMPTTCVITEQQPLCKIQLQVLVAGGQTDQQVCLHSNNRQHDCHWHNPATGSSFSLNIDTDKSQVLLLKTSDGKLLASGELKLVQYQGVHKRHKRGYLWNML
jgi:hypothetical protein